MAGRGGDGGSRWAAQDERGCHASASARRIARPPAARGGTRGALAREPARHPRRLRLRAREPAPCRVRGRPARRSWGRHGGRDLPPHGSGEPAHDGRARRHDAADSSARDHAPRRGPASLAPLLRGRGPARARQPVASRAAVRAGRCRAHRLGLGRGGCRGGAARRSSPRSGGGQAALGRLELADPGDGPHGRPRLQRGARRRPCVRPSSARMRTR